MKKNIFFAILFAFCSVTIWGQIPQTLVYEDTVSSFYAWNDNVIKIYETGTSRNRMIQVTINDQITHEYPKKGNNFIRAYNILSKNDPEQKDVIFGGYGTIYRLSLLTGKVDTLLLYNRDTENYYVYRGSQLIGEKKDVSLIGYDLNSEQIHTYYQFANYDEEYRQYSIWGIDNLFSDILFISFGDGYNMTIDYYIYNLRTNKITEFEASEDEHVNGIKFSHDDISKKFIISRDYWIDSSFNKIQPTLLRNSSTIQGFKLNKTDSHYYLYSYIDEPLQHNGSTFVWLACRFTLPFDMCLYKIYNNELLVKEEINGFDEWELHKLKNMIYAKHNYKFDSHYLQAFYNLFSFYRGQNNDVNHLLTPIDKKNLELIQKQANKTNL